MEILVFISVIEFRAPPRRAPNARSFTPRATLESHPPAPHEQPATPKPPPPLPVKPARRPPPAAGLASSYRGDSPPQAAPASIRPPLPRARLELPSALLRESRWPATGSAANPPPAGCRTHVSVRLRKTPTRPKRRLPQSPAPQSRSRQTPASSSGLASALPRVCLPASPGAPRPGPPTYRESFA